MREQDNVRTVEAVYAAFGRGDLGALLNTLAEDVTWHHPGPVDIPWAGERHGRDEVAEFFIAVNQHLEVEHFTPRTFVVRGDDVIVLGHERMRTRTGGRVCRTDWGVHGARRPNRWLPRVHRHRRHRLCAGCGRTVLGGE